MDKKSSSKHHTKDKPRDTHSSTTNNSISKFNIDQFIFKSTDKTEPIDSDQSQENNSPLETPDIPQNQKNYSLITFLTCKKRPDIYLGNNLFLSGNDYLNKKRPCPDEPTQQTQPQQKPDNTSDDNNNSEENQKNIYKELKSTSTRYFNFNTNITIKCFNCGEIGHMSRSCPNEQVVFCIRCNQKGHEDKDCPITKCFKCNRLGHKSFACPFKKKDLIICDRCNHIGHSAKDCLIKPFKINKYYLENNEDLFCVFCGSKEHLLCPFEKSECVIDFNVFNVNNEKGKENEEEGEIEDNRVFKSISNEEIAKTVFCSLCGKKHRMKDCKYYGDINHNEFDEKRRQYAESVRNEGLNNNYNRSYSNSSNNRANYYRNNNNINNYYHKNGNTFPYKRT